MGKRSIKMMRYPFGTITITAKAKKLVMKALEAGKVSGGAYVREFEKKFAELVGTKEAVAVSSGTDADALCLAVLYEHGARRGDEVIVPGLTFVATANAVLQAGFVPRFVDIERTTLNINPGLIEKAINKKTVAIMPVHLMGKPADMDRILKIARKHKIRVIEDAAEAQSAVYKGKNIGTMGDMAAFSLYIAHVISTVEGGIITTNNSGYAEILRSLRAHGRACKCEKCILSSESRHCPRRFKYGTDIRFIFERVGFSAKMNELEAAIGLGYMDAYPAIYAARKRNFDYIRKRFRKFKEYFFTIDPGPGEIMAPYAFPVILNTGQKFTKDKLVSFLEMRGIDTRSLFMSIPTQCGGYKSMGYRSEDFRESEYISANGFHIGLHQDITCRHIDYFISLLERFLEENI